MFKLPPASKLPIKYLNFSLGLIPFTNVLYNRSLTLKLIAVVGKYLITFAQLPLQNARTPSSLYTLVKQSTFIKIITIPLYCVLS